MNERPRPKSRERERVHVHVHMPASRSRDDEPGYSGHNGGQFSDAGYSSGRGQFGFQHAVLRTNETGE